MRKSNYFWLIDAGHGGLNSKGEYVTAPNKMYRFKDGFTIYEGVVNRDTANIVANRLRHKGIDFDMVHHEVDDIPLFARIHKINTIHKVRKNCIVVSIHSNAGGGSGIEVFTSPSQDKSDVIAEPLCKFYKEDFPEFKFRSDKSDGDLDKEANFAMVGGNKKLPLFCPSVLVENLFFDNRNEAELLMSPEFQLRIANTLVRWIEHIENIKPI